MHAEAAIGLIAAVSIDRLAISEPLERRFDVDVARGLEDRSKHSFRDRENIVGGDEGRFDVDLRELRLPVRPQIFVAKASRDLEIFFYASDHEQLFVLLRRLRERIKFAGRQTARHQKVARAFRRTLRQNRRLDFDVALRIEIIARRFCNAVAHSQIARQLRTPQIIIPISHPQIFIVDFGVDREGQHVHAIQDLQTIWNDFDIASRKF